MGNTIIYADAAALAQAAAELFVVRAGEAIKAHGRFSVALSGGSTPKAMHQRLATEPLRGQVDWAHVNVFWGDERCVAPDETESNYHMARETLLDYVPIPTNQIHRMRGEIDPAQAAAEYEAVLRGFFGPRPPAPSPTRVEGGPEEEPRFDLIFLGMGDDGHTASLFPGTAALDETRWVAPNWVEKLGAWRITLTAPAINAAALVAFLVAGEAKAERLAQVLNGPSQPHVLPSQLIRPTVGDLLWLVDKAAASKL